MQLANLFQDVHIFVWGMYIRQSPNDEGLVS